MMRWRDIGQKEVFIYSWVVVGVGYVCGSTLYSIPSSSSLYYLHMLPVGHHWKDFKDIKSFPRQVASCKEYGGFLNHS